MLQRHLEEESAGIYGPPNSYLVITRCVVSDVCVLWWVSYVYTSKGAVMKKVTQYSAVSEIAYYYVSKKEYRPSMNLGQQL